MLDNGGESRSRKLTDLMRQGPRLGPTDQTLDLRGQNATLRTELAEARNENDRLRTQINRDARGREQDRLQLTEVRNDLAVTRGMLIAARRHRAEADAKALRAELATVTEERDRSNRQNALLAAKLKVAALPPDHRAALENEFQRAEHEARAIMRTHDGIRADKAIRPRGQA